MAIPLLVAGGLMAAGTLAQAWGSHRAASQANEQARRQDEAHNVFRDSQLQQYQQGAVEGADTMRRGISDIDRRVQQDPLFRPEQLTSYDDLTRQSSFGESLYGAGTSHQDAMSRAIQGMDTGRDARSFSYDPTTFSAAQGQASQAEFIDSGRGMRAATLEDSALAELEQQRMLSQDLGAAARGEAPSIANQAMIGGMERAAQQQAGLAAQARGGANSLLMQRQAAQMGSQGMQDVAREGAMMSLDERERARAAYGQHLGGIRADAAQRDIQQAAFRQQEEQSNLQQRMSDAGRGDSINLANVHALNQMQQFNLINEMTARQHRADAQTAADRYRADSGMTADHLNVQRGDALAQQQAGATLGVLDQELGMRSDIDRTGTQLAQAASDANAGIRMGLIGQELDALGQSAFAGRDASQLGLGYGQQTARQEDPWAGTIDAVGSGLRSAGQMAFSQQ